MRILGIETSCDETSAAVIEANSDDQKVNLISNITASSLPIHAKTGGIIPENAARQQIKYIIPVIKQALFNNVILRSPVERDDVRISSSDIINNIDAIAVTIGPGLIGSLLIGVETAKTLAFVWNKPIIPINHLIGHIYANFINANSNLKTTTQISKPQLKSQNLENEIAFPAIVLIASGGHTDLLLMKKHGIINWLGGTRDDAAGEAFDKIGRLLNLSYPGGPAISATAEKFKVQSSKFKVTFPRPMIHTKDFDFSFSGLKTAVLREVKKLKEEKQFNNLAIQQLAYDAQEAIVDVLVSKTIRAAQEYKVKSILLSGGVSANQKLRDEFKFKIKDLKLKIPFFAPEKWFCTDNAAMIASAAFFNYRPIPFSQITADPELYFD